MIGLSREIRGGVAGEIEGTGAKKMKEASQTQFSIIKIIILVALHILL